MREPSIVSHPGAGWRGEPLMPPLDEAECLPTIVGVPATPAPAGAATASTSGWGWACPLAGAAVFLALLLALVIWGIWHDARHGMEGY